MTLYLGTTPIANTGYDRASLSLANVNDAGQILMSSMGMPSNTYDNLTLGSSGSTYTAPANGWVGVTLRTTSATFCNLWAAVKTSDNVHLFSTAQSHTSHVGNLDIFFPVAKNQVFAVGYSNCETFGTGSADKFRFTYAVGSESEAS